MTTSTLPGRVALAERLIDTRQTLYITEQMDAAEEADPPGTIKGTACRYSVPVDRGYGLYLQLEPGCFAGQVPHA